MMDGILLSEIAKKTGHSRNTVKRWLNTPEGVEPTYRRQHHDNKIAPHAAQLIKALETDAHRPKRDRRSALKLFDEIKVAGFTGDYSRVTEFIRRLKAEQRPKPTYRSNSNWAKPSSSTGARNTLSSAASGARYWPPTSSFAPAALSWCKPIRHKATKCCSMPIPGHLS